MTTADALLLADELQDRANHFGDRAGEGVHLGRAASALRDLAAQIDARDAVVPEPPPQTFEPPDSDAEVPVILDAASVNDAKPKKKAKSDA